MPTAWFDMPYRALPGDVNMPRVQSPDFGASVRFALSPGDEAGGYLHMPTGQSGHPYNAHYDDQIQLWLNGEYHPMLWSREAVETAAAEVLILQPGE